MEILAESVGEEEKEGLQKKQGVANGMGSFGGCFAGEREPA